MPAVETSSWRRTRPEAPRHRPVYVMRRPRVFPWRVWGIFVWPVLQLMIRPERRAGIMVFRKRRKQLVPWHY